MTDACHDSCVNACHTSVPCISGVTHHILGVCTLSREEHTTAQTREFVAAMDVLDEVVQKGKQTMFDHSQMLCDPLFIHRFQGGRSCPQL